MAVTELARPGQRPPRDRRGHVRIERLSVAFGPARGARLALAETSLEVLPGEFVCLLGPSGCGKSTLLNCVAGFVRPTSGRVTVDGTPVSGPGPDRGMVFQQYSLFPWKRVRDNVAFGPRVAGAGRREALRIADELLAGWGCCPTRTVTRASCRAACSSGSGSRGRSPAGRPCC